jgi:CBS domain-containing protein
MCIRLIRAQEFTGIFTCSVHDRLDTIVVIDENSKLEGVLTLSDILEYVLLEGADDEDKPLN